MSDAFSQHARAYQRAPPIAAALPFTLAAIRSWVSWTTVAMDVRWMLACFAIEAYLSDRGDIPAVAGPSACSGDLRLADPSDLEAVTTGHGDVLPFRIDIPSEVSAPSTGAL